MFSCVAISCIPLLCVPKSTRSVSAVAIFVFSSVARVFIGVPFLDVAMMSVFGVVWFWSVCFSDCWQVTV